MKDENKIKEILQEIRKRKGNPEEIDRFLNSYIDESIDKEIKSHPIYSKTPEAKATSYYRGAATDNLLHRLLGQAATEEIQDLEKMTPISQLKKVADSAYPGLSELAESLNYNPNISVEDLEKGELGSYQPSKGVKINKKLAENPEKALLMRGVVLHERSHSIDDVAAKLKEIIDEMDKRSERPKVLQFRDMNAYDVKKSYFENMRNSELARYWENVSDKLEKFKKQNPGKMEELLGQNAIKKFESLPYPGKKFENSSLASKTPLELQDEYTRGHFFNRNFGKSNLLNVLKGGIGSVLGTAINPLSVASQAVSALADLKEGKPNTAAARVVVGLAPPGAGQLEENLLEEAEIKDKYPKLQDPTYLRTIENIGKRRQKMGKSPIVEGFDEEKIDTSQTEKSNFENLMKKLKQEKSRG